jgi:SAM-dependent methyltransferase
VTRRRPDYGFDAPYVLMGFSVASLVAVAVAVSATARASTLWMVIGYTSAAWFAATSASFAYTTRRGKLTVWREIIDGLDLRGDERALDAGCGRGAVLVLLADRLSRGRVAGIDSWSRSDQSGNSEAVARANAALAGVSDRIDLYTGDLRTLPFEDASFDLVTSSLAIHNIPYPSERARVLDELLRVVKPGGIVLIADIRFTADYDRHYLRRGVPVERRALGWRFWYGGPHMSTALVTARRPALQPAA